MLIRERSSAEAELITGLASGSSSCTHPCPAQTFGLGTAAHMGLCWHIRPFREQSQAGDRVSTDHWKGPHLAEAAAGRWVAAGPVDAGAVWPRLASHAGTCRPTTLQLSWLTSHSWLITQMRATWLISYLQQGCSKNSLPGLAQHCRTSAWTLCLLGPGRRWGGRRHSIFPSAKRREVAALPPV